MTHLPVAPAPQGRVHFLDWLRILAFGLLVPYHVGMYYVSWDWHVKSPHAGTAIEPLMLLTAPWRLSLLFFIAGAATTALLARSAGSGFLRRRSAQLLWPLAFGMLVVVPPQAYFEVVEKTAYSGSYADFMRLYVSGYGGFCRGADCLVLPTWNHLWFLPYLWLYGVLAWVLWRSAPQALDRAAAGVGRCSAVQLLLLPALPLMASRLLVGTFGSTHDFIWDWYNHAQYLSVFMIGLLFGRRGHAWPVLERLRWPALLLALLGWALYAAYVRAYATQAPPPELQIAQRLMYGLLQWSAIVAACGFARRWLDFDHPWRRVLTPAVFCVYILHQTVIVLLTRLMLPWHWPAPAEAVLLVLSTFAVSATGYVVARRVPLLRGALGIRRPSASPMP